MPRPSKPFTAEGQTCTGPGCGVPLVPLVNWNKSAINKRTRRCRDCQAAAQRRQKQLKAEMDAWWAERDAERAEQEADPEYQAKHQADMEALHRKVMRVMARRHPDEVPANWNK